MSPTTVFPAAAECMSSNRGPLWDWPPSTPDINALQLFLTLPFYMSTTPLHLQSERSQLRCDILLLLDLCYNKSSDSFFLHCRCYSVLLGMCRRDLVHISPHGVLSLFISFCLLCCIPGKEVKIAFALQVLYVGVYKWHYKQILLY